MIGCRRVVTVASPSPSSSSSSSVSSAAAVDATTFVAQSAAFPVVAVVVGVVIALLVIGAIVALLCFFARRRSKKGSQFVRFFARVFMYIDGRPAQPSNTGGAKLGITGFGGFLFNFSTLYVERSFVRFSQQRQRRSRCRRRTIE